MSAPESFAERASDLLPPEQPVRLLDEDGTFHESTDYPLDLKDDDYQEMYRLMVLARRVDGQAITLQRQGQLGVWASLLGQEAAQIGTAYALGPSDWVFPTYRELGCALVRGMEPEPILHMFRGTWLSDHNPYEHGFALFAIPIGTQMLHAVGYAMGAALDGANLVVASYLGDGATSGGDAHEAMNFAAVFGAPCVFVVQNNQYAISMPVAEQTKAPTIAHKAIGYGMPGVRCDGNDVLASYAVMRAAVERARQGHGPSLIEAVTYRMEAHTTADDASRYRTEGERSAWQTRDPITRFERFLQARGLLDDDIRSEVEDEAEALAERVRTAITDAPHGDPLELFEHVYVDPPASFARQRAMLERELGDRRPDGAAPSREPGGRP